MFIAQKRDTQTFNHERKFFVKNPKLFGDGSCIYTVNKAQDGIEFIIGLPGNAIEDGAVKWADMKMASTSLWLQDKKWLELHYENLKRPTTGQ